MLQVGEAVLHQSRHVDLLGNERESPEAGQLEDFADQRIHPVHRALDEAERLGHVLVDGFDRRRPALGGPVDVGRRHGALERVGRLFEFRREPHDVDERRAEVVTDDIGVALEFVVGAREIARARRHALLEFRVDARRARRGRRRSPPCSDGPARSRAATG